MALRYDPCVNRDMQRVVNLTPYTVIVFSGWEHWCPAIEELEEAFCTLREAEDYAETIKKYRPEYFAKIIAEGGDSDGPEV